MSIKNEDTSCVRMYTTTEYLLILAYLKDLWNINCIPQEEINWKENKQLQQNRLREKKCVKNKLPNNMMMAVVKTSFSYPTNVRFFNSILGQETGCEPAKDYLIAALVLEDRKKHFPYTHHQKHCGLQKWSLAIRKNWCVVVTTNKHNLCTAKANKKKLIQNS